MPLAYSEARPLPAEEAGRLEPNKLPAEWDGPIRSACHANSRASCPEGPVLL